MAVNSERLEVSTTVPADYFAQLVAALDHPDPAPALARAARRGAAGAASPAHPLLSLFTIETTAPPR